MLRRKGDIVRAGIRTDIEAARRGYGVVSSSKSNETRIWSNDNYLLFRVQYLW